MAVNSGSPNVNPNANPSVNTNPAPPPPPPPAGIGSGPTGNSGFSQSESTMSGLQGRAGDMQARLSNISSGLRGLNLGMGSLGPIGLFAVPALNNSNDHAVAQAERGSKAFGDVQQGLKATQQVTVSTDTNNASSFRGIDPNNTFKPVPGAANSIAPPPKQGGAQVSQKPNIPGASGPAPAPTRTAGGPAVSTAPKVPGAGAAPGVNTGGPGGANVSKAPTIPGAGT
ncbi:MAG TPA: hypothetical protein VNO31_37800, partial [Umezawaea sp.]|nr:hypothetical protein [Umezawaea sp.]